ncbi:little elongation complex subunit 2 isoform X2 [Prinia subflava]|uniref:little elongation complex subunit 2 isoform X2 n=1 Tax=Prinia subflava TaxID=208062 RepID=UPI002FE2D60A
MAAAGPPLTWDISPKNGQEVFFSHELYEKYSLSPSLSELWHLSNREAKKNAEALANSSENRQTCSVQAAESLEVQAQSPAEAHPLPEPRLPYPFTSCLTEKEQKTYLYLMTKFSKKRNHFQVTAASQREFFTYMQMKEVVSNEIAEFMKFAQNAAKSCAQDYDAISEDARRYTEELLHACIGQVQKYPEFYTLQEIMSIMGGKFHTQLTFKLEKNLLAMGTARRGNTDFPSMPVQLPTDYSTVTSIITPEKKAHVLHNDISSDSNAEKLALKYCPQVVLSSQALFTLLNNHGLNYKEQWEIPVCVKMIPVAGSKPAKIVYVDPPLLRKEMTVRERNQIFHEIPMDFLATKTSYVSISDISMDKPAEDSLLQWDVCSGTYQCRTVPPPDDTGMDFDGDVTELETFGATTKRSRACKMESTCAAADNTAKILSHGPKMGGNNSSAINNGDEEEKNTLSEQEGSACASMQLPSSDGIPCFSPQEHSPESSQSVEAGLSRAQDNETNPLPVAGSSEKEPDAGQVIMTKEVLDNETNPLPVAGSSEKEPDAAQVIMTKEVLDNETNPLPAAGSSEKEPDAGQVIMTKEVLDNETNPLSPAGSSEKEAGAAQVIMTKEVLDNETNPLSPAGSSEKEAGAAQVIMTKEVLDNETNPLSVAGSSEKEPDAAQIKETYTSFCSSDTDEERLVIDTECETTASGKPAVPASVSCTSAETPGSPPPSQCPTDCSGAMGQRKKASKKPPRKSSKELDPVGQILKMQTELLKSPSQKAPEPVVSCDNPSAVPAQLPQSPKALVTSSTEPVPAPASNPSSSSRNTWTWLFEGVPKRKLPSELELLEEDPSEYQAPEEGNVVYKLFSLNDLLLLVRCSVQKVKPLPQYQKRKKAQKLTPMFLLPKLEYQAYYGVEALTESEVCQLWTQSLLHSECSFCVGHIDAFTSKLIMLEKISPQNLREKLGLIKPANSLNILHHVLKKVSDLEEGSYLLTHAAGDSSVAIYRSSLAKSTRSCYNLHKAHCHLPAVPATLSVPWVPLEPSLPLPYHISHGRVPCTFPPAPQEGWRQKPSSWKHRTLGPSEQSSILVLEGGRCQQQGTLPTSMLWSSVTFIEPFEELPRVAVTAVHRAVVKHA